MFFPTKDYQASNTEGKNKILARLQESGMQDLSWYTQMEVVTTAIEESMDKKRDGLCCWVYFIFFKPKSL